MLSRLLLVLVLVGVVAGGVAAADPPPVTFSQHIAPLLQQHCQECHRPGGGAPFTLAAYQHVYQRRDKILESVEKRRMPPWKAVPGYGDLAGERRLSDVEIATLARWVAAGAPEGDPRDLPPPREFTTATAPAGNPRYEVQAGSVVGRPLQLIAIHPHMHMLGREMKVWARMKDESIKPLIYINDWDFNWQGFYWFRAPVTLPAASWIELTASWDNSSLNPRNPNKPAQDVYWGERTVDEMGHAAILYTLDDEKP